MNEHKEQISAFLDDGLSADEIEALSAIESDSKSGFSVASRYQMIGDALRGQVSEASMTDISARVRDALRDEPVIKVASSKRKTTANRAPLFDFSAWFRPLGGLAVAATVAAVTVVAVQQLGTPTSQVPGATALVADNDAQKINIPANAVISTPVVETVTSTTPARPAVNLDTYLVEHAEFASQDTMQGRMPYARAVSYESR